MKLSDTRQLDWNAVSEAADDIKRVCHDVGFAAPEDVAMARDYIVRVCRNLDAITKALLITPPGARR